MKLCNKEDLKKFGANSPITVIRQGPFRYAAVTRDGFVIARGLKLRKYYNPYIPGKSSGAMPGRIRKNIGHHEALQKCWSYGDGHYELRLEDPKNLNRFDTVCVWR